MVLMEEIRKLGKCIGQEFMPERVILFGSYADGTPLPTDFWQSPSLDQLVELQGVRPLADIASLFGTWPGDPDDGFEEAVRALRIQTSSGG